MVVSTGSTGGATEALSSYTWEDSMPQMKK